MASYGSVKLLQAKGLETEKRMANVQRSQTVGIVKAHEPHFTHNLILSVFCIFFVLFFRQ